MTSNEGISINQLCARGWYGNLPTSPKNYHLLITSKESLKNVLLSLKPREKSVEIIYVTSNEGISINQLCARGWYGNVPTSPKNDLLLITSK